jgi:diamine N-acetyltransferase
MTITLTALDRDNWREVIELKVRPDQARFVATPLFSIAAALVRRWGDQYVHAPGAISDGDVVVGYFCTVCDPASTDDLWIDDILIDARFQGRGYGRAAIRELLGSIVKEYPRCSAIKLSCDPRNDLAAGLYVRMGFRANGLIHPDTGNHEYELSGEALRPYFFGG